MIATGIGMETVFIRNGNQIERVQQLVGTRVFKNFAIKNLLKNIFSKQKGTRTGYVPIPGCYDPKIIREAFKRDGEWLKKARTKDSFVETLKIWDQEHLCSLLSFQVWPSCRSCNANAACAIEF